MRFRRWSAVLVAGGLLAGGCGGRPGVDGTGGSHAGCGPVSAVSAARDVDPVEADAEPELPVTVRSADGRSVTVEDTSRILAVNLYGSLAEIVFSLGLGDRVVGRDPSTTFPSAAGKPLVTTQGHDLSAEAILGLDPTVVLADGSIGPPEVLTQLRQSGIPVVLVDDEQTTEAIDDHITAVAKALGVPEAGRKLNERVSAQLDRARRSGTDHPLRIAFLYLRGTAGVYLIGGEGAGSDAMIEAIGAEDAGTAAGLKGFRPLTSEGLINAAPDVILVLTSGLESVGGVDGLLELPGVAQTPAGRDRRVVDVEDGSLLTFGARTGSTIEALADAVYRKCGS